MNHAFASLKRGLWRILAPTSLGMLFLLSTNTQAQLSGTVTVGSGGTYPGLTTATTGLFAVLNAQGTSGPLTVNIVGTNAITESGNTALSGASVTHAITIQRDPSLGTQAVFTCTNNANGTIRIGRPNVTIDGRVVGVGHGSNARKLLSFQGSGNGSVFGIFSDNADGVTIKNVDIVTGSSGTNGNAINIGQTATGNGIDNFTLQNCTIHPTGTARMLALFVHSNNLLNAERHDGLTITGNSIYNFGPTGANVTMTNFVRWANASITNNNYYQTNTVAPTGNATWCLFQVQSTSGGFNFSNNFIGGSDTLATGNWLVASTGNGFVRLFPFRLEQASTEPTTTVNNNTFKNLDLLMRWNGNCNESAFINWVGTGTNKGNYNITNNKFGTGGTIKMRRDGVDNTRTEGEFEFWRIYSVNDLTMTGNQIENIEFFLSPSTVSNGANIYAHLIHLMPNDGFTGTLTGNINISNNVFKAIKTTQSGAAGSSVMAFSGINCEFGQASGSTANITISGNTFTDIDISPRSLSYSHGDATCTQIANSTLHTTRFEAICVGALGALNNTTTGAVKIFNNKVSNFKSSLDGINIYGIRLLGQGSGGGNIQVYSNAISLGEGATASNNAVYKALAVEPAAASGTAAYYVNNNTLHVGGTATGSNNTYAVFLNTNAVSTNLRNNIVQNIRTGSTGTHYAFTDMAAQLNSNFNIVYSNTKIGNIQGTDHTSFAAWQGAGFDGAGSQNIQITFGDAVNGNLAVTNCSAITGVTTSVSAPYAVVTTDIAGTSHPSPVSPGAYVITVGSNGFLWLGAVSSSWTNAANWCGGAGIPTGTDDVTINDDSPRPFWPVISSNQAVKNLTLSGSTTQFTINSTRILTINGDYTSSATAANISVTGSIIQFPKVGVQTANGFKGDFVTVSGGFDKTFSGTSTIGTLTLGTTNIITGAGGTLSITGNVTSTGGTIKGTPTGNLVFASPFGVTLPLATNQTFQDITVNATGGGIVSASGTLNVRNLTLAAGTFSAGSATINISGNLTRNAGTISSGTSTFVLNGASAQTISGNMTFNNLTVHKITNTDVNGSGTGTITVNGLLTIRQDNTGLGVSTTLALGSMSLALSNPVIDGGVGDDRLTMTSASTLTLSNSAVWPWNNISGTAPNTLTGLVLNTTGAAGTLSSSLTISGSTVLTAGTLAIGANTVTLNGPISGAAGTLSTSAAGSLVLGGSGAISYLPNLSGSYSHINLGRAGTYSLSGNITANRVSLLTGVTLNTQSNNITIAGTDGTSGRLGDGILNSNGTVTFSGTFAQTINGTNNLTNLTVNSTNASGLTHGTGVTTNIKGVVTLGVNGKFNVTGGTFTLKHNNATERGSVAALPAGAALTGNIALEQRVLTNTPGWYLFSTPVKAQVVSNLNGQILYRGVPGAPSFSGNGNPTIFNHNEALSAANGWTSATNVNNSLNKAVRIWLDANFINNVKKFTFTGNLTVGDGTNQVEATGTEAFTYSVTRTPGGAFGGGWNLLHNPFPSNLLLDNSSAWAASNISPTFHFWDAVSATYLTWNRNTASGTKGNALVALGQSFFVEATGSSPALSVREAAKTSSNTSLIRQGAPQNQLLMTLKEPNGTFKDMAILGFEQGSTNGYDLNSDARNLNGGVFDLATLSSTNDELTINMQDAPYQMRTVPMVYSSYLAAGSNLQFTFDGVDSFINMRLYLQDRTTGSNTLLSQGATYSFTQDAAANVRDRTRFAIVMVPMTVTALDANLNSSLSLNLYPNPANTSEITLSVAGLGTDGNGVVDVLDAVGKLVYTNNLALVTATSTHKLSLGVAAGIYQVRVKANGQVLTQKLVVR